MPGPSNDPGRPGAQDPLRFLMRIPVPWVFVLAYVAGIGLDFGLPPAFRSQAPPGVFIGGAILFAAGAVIAGWGWVLFRRAGTTRVPGQPSTSLVTSGPYRVCRNPMYVGLALAYLGEAGLLEQLGPVVLLPLVLAYLNGVVVRVEEARLREVFGDAYDRYCARTRRWI